MSDIYGRPTRDPYGISSGDPYSNPTKRSGGLTDAQRELRPYIEREKEKKTIAWSAVGLLPMVFDVLQTGNYMSAGIADAIWKSVKNEEPFPDAVKKTIKAAWDGLTWKDKKVYSDVIRGNLDPDRLAELDKKVSVAGFNTGISPVSVMGFVADVLLDPTTYVGFGATQAARATAQDAALTQVKLAAKNFSKDQLQGLKKLGIDQNIFTEAVSKGNREILDKAGGVLGNEPVRYLNDIYKKAYKEALITPAEKLRNRQLIEARESLANRSIDSLTTRQAQKLQKKGFTSDVVKQALVHNDMKVLDGMYKAVGAKVFDKKLWPEVGTVFSRETLEDIIAKVSNPTTYALSQQRGATFLGMNIPGTVSVRDPNVISRQWGKLKTAIGETKAVDSLGEAWWRIWDSPVMRDIKSKLNIKSPYEKAVKMQYLQEQSNFDRLLTDKAGEIFAMAEPLSVKDREGVSHIIAIAAHDRVKNKISTKDAQPLWEVAEKFIRNAEKFGQPLVENPEKVIEFIKSKEARDKLSLLALKRIQAEGLIQSIPQEFAYYTRTVYRDPPKNVRAGIGGSSPSIVQHKQFSTVELIEQDMKKMIAEYGLDTETAYQVATQLGGYGVSTDLMESLMTRELIQAKIESKANLLRMMKEFGINLDQLKLGPAEMNKFMQEAKDKGLHALSSPVPAFDGLLVDGTIKDIIDRVVSVVQPRQEGAFKTLMAAYHSWWKGTALMAPSTKIRNFVDNNFTGFLLHGPRWFNIKKYDIPSVIATVYASKKSDPIKALQQFGLTEGYAKNILNTTWYSDGARNITLREIAEEARSRGVYSHMTMGKDAPDTVKTLMGVQKESLGHKIAFAGQNLSHSVDEIIENTGRIKSFLMDFEDIVKDLPTGSDVKFAFDYASQKARVQFVDYADLSDWEKNVAKYYIPFYNFIRHNVANKLQAIVMHPDTFAIFPKFQEMVQVENPDYDPDLIPAYMKQLGMFPALELGDKTFGMFNTGLSVQNLNLLPFQFQEGSLIPEFSGEELKDSIVSSANPIIKTIVEMIPEKGYDTFRKRDLASTAKAPFLMRFLVNHPMPLAFMDGIMRKIGFEDGLRATVDDDGKLNIDAKMARIMESNLPVLRHLDMYLLTGTEALESLVPGFQKMMEEDFAMKSDYEGLEKTFQILAYWTGLKFKENDVDEMKKQLSRDIYYSAQKRRVDDMRLGEAYKRRKATYRKREDTKIRRLVR